MKDTLEAMWKKIPVHAQADIVNSYNFLVKNRTTVIKPIDKLFDFSNSIKLNYDDIFFLFSELTEVLLKGKDYIDISFIKEFSFLKKVTLEGTEVSDLSPLIEINGLGEKRIERIYADYAPILSYQPLTRLPNLKVFSNSFNTVIRDFTPLTRIENLEEICLRKTYLDRLDYFTNLKGLKALSINACTNIQDFTPLSKMQSLEEIDISRTQIPDLKVLASLKNLRKITMSHCYFMDKHHNPFQPLIELKNLEEIHCYSGIKPVFKSHFYQNRLSNAKIIDTMLYRRSSDY